MIDPRNTVIITGGLVADPEKPAETIVKFRIGVDFAGNEKGSDNNSGYFDVTYWLNNGTKNAEFVNRQVTEGKLKKGSRVQILGRLVQDRWEANEKKNSRVVIVAEALTYLTSGAPSSGSSDSAPASAASVPSSF